MHWTHFPLIRLEHSDPYPIFHVASGPIATHPEGFWDVHQCTRTPLCDAGQVRSQLVFWSGKWGSRRCVQPACSRDRTEPAESRTGWNRARTGPRDGGSSCSLDTIVSQSLTFLNDIYDMPTRAFVHTLTWNDVIVWGDGVAFVKHKKFPPIETFWESLQILVDSTLQLVNPFTHILKNLKSRFRAQYFNYNKNKALFFFFFF